MRVFRNGASARCGGGKFLRARSKSTRKQSATYHSLSYPKGKLRATISMMESQWGAELQKRCVYVTGMKIHVGEDEADC